MRQIRAVAALFGIVIGAFVAVPVMLILRQISKPLSHKIPPLFHKWLLIIVRLKVKTYGTPASDRPVLITPNHASYLDIPVLGSMNEGSFVAKAEIARWPFFGPLARSARTIFIQRERRHTSHKQRDEIMERLNDGESIVVFPEGTSNDGNRVQKFKPTLFAAAEKPLKGYDGHHPWVQPVSVGYTHLHGIPVGRRGREIFAWYGDMTLAPHLWFLLTAGPSDAVVLFHEPVLVDDFKNRKELARYCHEKSALGLGAILAGRSPEALEALSWSCPHQSKSVDAGGNQPLPA